MTIRDLKNLPEEAARELFESVMWPHGPTCPFCGNCSPKRIAKLTPNPAKRIRAGLYMCKDCKPRRQFTVTTGTIFHGSHFPLSFWLYIIASMATAKAGTSTAQIRRELKEARVLPDGTLGYGNIECLWHATMRVRKAMREEPVRNSLKGVLHVDEGYLGGKPRHGKPKKNPWSDKQPFAVLVERDGKKAYTRVVPDTSRATLFDHVTKVADPSSTIMSDEHLSYKGIGEHFDGGHRTVRHGVHEYGRTDEDGMKVNNNMAEAYIGFVKKAYYGVHFHWSRVHSQRYLDERDFMWSTREMSDTDRVLMVLRQSIGKRLLYRRPKGDLTSPIDGLLSPPQQGEGDQAPQLS